MSSEMKLGVVGGGQDQQQQQHPPEPENLQCPRCESTNTKFCYYNNYNLSQPRYFCKSCRRYWTRGGSLRNIPVGGGTRKNSKRPRSTQSSPAAPLTETPVSFSVKTESTQTPPPPPTLSPFRSDMNLNEALPGSFSSMLGSHQPAGAFLGLAGYSLGPGPGPVSSGFDMLGFGFGPAMVDGESGKGGNTWQMMDGGLTTDGGDCFGWPDLAISTPGTTAGLE